MKLTNSFVQVTATDLLARNQKDVMDNLFKKQAAALESSIASQLNEFIKRGLIVAEVTSPVLVHVEAGAGIELRQQVILKLKDQEYVEKLEKENQILKTKVESIENALRGNHEAQA